MGKTRILLFLSIVFFCYNCSFSQYGWVPLVSNTVNNLNGVFFINAVTGFAVGDNSTIVRTTNSGAIWLIQTSPVNTNFKDIHFIDENTGYISGFNGKIIKTTNGGLNWTALNITDTTSFNAVFFIADTGYAAGSGGKIIKTTNGGINWTQKTSNTTFQLNGIYFIDSQTGYICGGNNVSLCIMLKTTNGGNNWSPQQKTQVASFTKVFFPNSVTGWTVGYNPGDSGVASRTTDGGTVWSYRTVLTTVRLNSIFWFDGNSGYIVGNNGTIIRARYGFVGMTFDTSGTTNNLMDITYSGSSLYAVGNSGIILRKNFEYLKAILNNINEPNSGRIYKKYITLSDTLCIGSKDTVEWYVNNQFISNQHSFTFGYPQGMTFVKLIIKDRYGSADSATSTVTRGLFSIQTPGSILGGCSLIGDSVLYAVSTNTTYRMDINGNIIFPFTGGNILSPCSIGRDTSIFISSADNNLYGISRYGTQLWPAIALGASAVSTPAIDFIYNRIYIGIANGNFLAVNKSTGSVNWSYFADAPIKNSAVISSEDKLVFVSSTGTLYGFILAGITTPPVPDWVLHLNDSVTTSPAIDEFGYIYTGTIGGKLNKISLPFSGQPSVVWQCNLNSAVTTSPVIDAYGHIYAGTANGRLYSVRYNGSINWFYTSKAKIRSTPAISNASTIYFGNDGGELIGLDTNKNIKFYYADTSKISCPVLYKSGSLYLGTESGRILAFYDSTGIMSDISRRNDSILPVWGTFQKNTRRTGNQTEDMTSGINNNPKTLINQFELRQNYPNPFNPETKISFNIEKICHVKLSVYDAIGREVSVLINQKYKPGNYDITWNAFNLPSGIYYCRIKADNYIETKKMILIK